MSAAASGCFSGWEGEGPGAGAPRTGGDAVASLAGGGEVPGAFVLAHPDQCGRSGLLSGPLRLLRYE